MSKLILTEQSSTPATATTGKSALYFRTDGILRSIDDTGTVTTYSGATFGSEFYEYSSDAESSTTSTTYQTKLTGSPTLTSGNKYRIGFSAQLRNSGSSNSFSAEFSINGETTWVALREQVADTDTDFAGGFHYYTPGSTGVKNLTIKYKRTGTTGTVYITYAKIEVWRVS